MRTYATKPIPDALAKRLLAVGIPSAPSTLGELVALVLSTQGPIADPEVLCTGTDSRHQITIGNQTRNTHCVLDTLILPFALGLPGVVRSVSPLTGTVVEVRASAEVVQAEPAGAIVSFGLRRDGEGTFYELGCPYINAFASIDEYEQWAAATPEAVSVALSIAEAHALARALSGRDPEELVPGAQSADCAPVTEPQRARVVS